MPGPKQGYRIRLFGAVHSEALKRRMDHDALHDLICGRYKLSSMSEATDAQLEAVYREFTGKGLRRAGKLPKRGELAAKGDEMVSPADLEMLGAEFARRGLGTEGQKNFVRRQLRGRDEIRTRKDLVRVIGGLRAMNRRAGVA
jgi:hypothetical protein